MSESMESLNQDIQSILAPIEPESPTGRDLRLESSDFDAPLLLLKRAYRDARHQEKQRIENPQSPDETGAPISLNPIIIDDWIDIQSDCIRLLTKDSKDLEVLSWLLEAWTRLHGFRGIAAGFDVAKQWIDTYQDALYPSIKDTRHDQIEPLIQLQTALVNTINLIPLVDAAQLREVSAWFYQQLASDTNKTFNGLSEQSLKQLLDDRPLPKLKEAQQAIAGAQQTYEDYLNAASDYVDGGIPNSERMLGSLKNCAKQFRLMTKGHLPTETPKPKPVVQAESTTSKTSSEDSPIESLTDEIQNRRHAVEILKAIAVYFRLNEPHSPLFSSVARVVRWSEQPIEHFIDELVPDEKARFKYQELSGLVPQQIQNSGLDWTQVTPGAVNSRHMAIQQLHTIVDFFKASEPHSPMICAIERVIRWSGLSHSELIKEMIPNQEAREKYQDLSGLVINE